MSDVVRAPVVDTPETHFDRCMDTWQQWMRGGDSHRLDYPSRDSVSGKSKTNYMTSDEDTENAAAESERQEISIVGQSVNACVSSLMPHHRHAVLMHYGFSRVWPYLNLDRQSSFELGMTALRRLVAKRC